MFFAQKLLRTRKPSTVGLKVLISVYQYKSLHERPTCANSRKTAAKGYQQNLFSNNIYNAKIYID